MEFSGRAATAIIVFLDGKILLVRRATKPFKGYWGLSGGKANPGEKVEQTAVREVKEETGLHVAIIEKIGEYHVSGTQAGVEYDYYPACFLVKPIGKNSRRHIERQETEIEEIKLFSLSKIPKELAFGQERMVHDYLCKVNQKKGCKTGNKC